MLQKRRLRPSGGDIRARQRDARKPPVLKTARHGRWSNDGARDGGAGLTRGCAGCVKLWNVGSLEPLHEHVSMCRRVGRGRSRRSPHIPDCPGRPHLESGGSVSARACGRAAVRLGHCTALHQTGQTDRRAAAELALRDADAKIGARRGHISQLILVLFTSRTYTVCWRQAGLSVCRGPGFRRSDSHTLSLRPRSRNYVCERGRVWDSKTC
jgi:hypothetical protein